MQLQNLVTTKSNFQIKLNRVLQIAYNLGQLCIVMELGKTPKDLTKFVHDNNLLKIDTYVSEENQRIINERYLDGKDGLDKIKQNIHLLNGGGLYDEESKYYKKYLKYKLKYLKEKKKLI